MVLIIQTLKLDVGLFVCVIRILVFVSVDKPLSEY